jgi:ATPase family associated with various cellular activities (AAA)
MESSAPSIGEYVNVLDHVWKSIVQDQTREGSSSRDKKGEEDHILFFNQLTVADASPNSSSKIHLINFVRKYTNLPLSTIANSLYDGNSSTATAKIDPISSSKTQQRQPKLLTVLHVTLEQSYDILGMLRSLKYDLQLYNQSLNISCKSVENVAAITSDSIRYFQYRFMKQVESCCNNVRMVPSSNPVQIDGLNELILYIEHYFHDRITDAKEQIDNKQVDFSSLTEYCTPGTVVIDSGLLSGCSGTYMAVRCRGSRYRRNKTSTGRIVSIHETAVEFIVALGNEYSALFPQQPRYAVVETQWIQTEFDNSRSIQFSQSSVSNDMLLLPNQVILDELKHRGILYQSCCFDAKSSSSGVFVDYVAGSFYPCHSPFRKTSNTAIQPMSSSIMYQPSRLGGRIMIDIFQSWVRGIHVCKPPADGCAAESILNIFQSYARYVRRHRQQQRAKTSEKTDPISTNSAPSSPAFDLGPEDMLVLYSNEILHDFIALTWPVMCGFSFVTQNWGVVLVEGLSHIQFHASAFDDSLVIPPARKRLLRAILTSHGKKDSQLHHSTTLSQAQHVGPSWHQGAAADVLPGKGEGVIVLLYGPPGVGKTLTAEAVAELLHRPLYRVSMGELGTTPEHLDDRLQDVFDLCTPWHALVLIDEAELLLKERTSTDLVRNAMVCVMLRLLEYYPGILFLTTNSGIEELDPAIASRITVSLEYKTFDLNSRKEIWRASLSRVMSKSSSNTDSSLLSDDNVTTLATKYCTINGRQIKNVAQLALIVSNYEQEPLTMSCIEDIVGMTMSSLSSDGSI